MSRTPDDTSADMQRTIDDLWRQLAERTRERDEALERQTVTAKDRWRSAGIARPFALRSTNRRQRATVRRWPGRWHPPTPA